MLEHDQIRRRIFINSGSMAACRGVSAIFSLILVPIVVKKLGMTGYGTWEIIFSAATICSMMQSATINTLLWQISNAYGLKNEDKIRRLLRIGITITLVQFIIIFPFVWFYRHDLVSAFHVSQSVIGLATLLLPLFCGMMVLNGINECIGAVISGYQCTGLVTFVQSSAQVLNYCVSILCLFCGFGLISLFIGYVVNYFIAGILYLVIVKRYCLRLQLSPALITRNEMKELYSYFTFMIIGSFSGMFRDEKDRMVLTTFYSPEWVGYYSISLRLIGFITLMNNFFYVPVMTAVGALNAKGDWGSISRVYSNTISIIAVTVGFIAILISGLHERILVLWIGKDSVEVGGIIIWLVIGNISAIFLTGPGSAICKGIGRMGMEASYWGIGIIINTILTLILIKTHGAIGSIAASSLSWAISSMFFLWFFHKNVDLPWRISFRSVKALIIILLSVILLKYISGIWPNSLNRADALWQTSSLAIVAFIGYISLLVAAKIIPLSIEPILFVLKRNTKSL